MDLILQEVHKSIEELQITAQLGNTRTGQEAPPSNLVSAVAWTKPDYGAIKINCNGAWSSSSRHGGVGVISRDSSGMIMGGSQGRVEGGSPEEVEAKAILQAVQLAVARGWSDVVVESDSTIVINHNLGKVFAWRIDTIMSNALSLATSVDRIVWVHIPRFATNACADWIAKQVLAGLCPLD